MKKFLEFLRNHSLIIGILLMFGLTWPIDLANSGVLPIDFPFGVYLFLGWGFVLASITMTWLTLGRAAVRRLLRRYLIWQVNWKWYLAAFFLPAALMIISVYLNSSINNVPPDFSTIMAYKIFGDTKNLALFILPYFLIDLIANGEEIGWRGYILPRLQGKYSALTASLTLGVVWSLWHLPKFLPNFDLISFAWFTVHILAFSVFLTCLYNHTKGSLLLVAICHASSNTAGLFLPLDLNPSSPQFSTYILFSVLEVTIAIFVTLYSGSKQLSHTSPVNAQ